MSNETMAVDQPATEFSPTELASLRERREALGASWVEVVRAEQSEADKGLSVDALEQIERIQREYSALSATIKEHEQAKEQSELVKAGEELTSQAPNYRDFQAKKEAQFFKNLMATGQGRYTNPSPTADPKGGSHPGSLEIAQPLIAKGSDGRNRVFPVAAVFNTAGPGGEQSDANIEASFRQAEIIASDKFRKYDALSGNRVSAHLEPVGKQLEADLGFGPTSISGIDESVADVYLRQGGALYQYEIQRNELAQYMDIRQLPYVNDFIIDRRTGIGTFTAGTHIINEAGNISEVDSAFDTITITPKKFAHLRSMTYESSQLMEPWSVAQTIMTDAGIFMGVATGQQVVTGNGAGFDGAMNTQFRGLRTWSTDTSGAANEERANNSALPGGDRRHTLSTAANFLPAMSSGSTFGVSQMASFMTSLPKEYFRAPGKLLSMTLTTWGKLMGVTDGERRKLFTSSSSLEDMSLPDYNVRVVIDENWGDGSDNTAANNPPFFYGDFGSATYVMYGPMRVDYSSEYKFVSDRYTWRFIAHRGFAIVDRNGLSAGIVS